MSKIIATFLMALVLTIVGCSIGARAHHDEEREEPELAPFMGQLQRFSQKLGYSIQGKNQPLSDFYLHELKEVLEELEEIEEHDGMPISHPVRVIMKPLVADMEEALSSSKWNKSKFAYSKLINGCNRCHNATEHEYIEITSPQGDSPFNQEF